MGNIELRLIHNNDESSIGIGILITQLWNSTIVRHVII